MTITTTPTDVLTRHLVVLSRAGWRIDGWPAMAALDAAWNDPGGPILLDGPSGLGITSLTQLSSLLPLMAESGWTAAATGPTTGPWRTHLLIHDRHDPVPVVSRWHSGGVTSILTPAGMLVPPPDQQLTRRLHTLVSTPTGTAVWVRAAVDIAALVDAADRSGTSSEMQARLPRWLLNGARDCVAGAPDLDWPGHRSDDVRARLVAFTTARP